MNKFNIEYNNILKKENFIQQNLIEQNYILDHGKKLWNATGGRFVKGLSAAWNSISDIGSDIANAINKGIKWGTNKIKAALQKFWDMITPDNVDQIMAKIKSLINIMPDNLANQSKTIINTLQTKQFKTYLAKQINTNYKPADSFNSLSNAEQKRFIQKVTNKYINDNKIISQEIINEGFMFLINLIAFVVVYFIMKNEGKKLLNAVGFLPKTPEQQHKQKEKEIYAMLDLEKAKATYEQWKNDQQRQKIFRQIINIKTFMRQPK